jgi:heme exporter protein B
MRKLIWRSFVLIINLIKHDIKLALKKGSGVGNMLSFYLIVSTLFVFGIGSDPKNTTLIAPAVIWVCALLVQAISVSRIFADDYEDGTLEQLILLGDLPEKIILARMVSNWLSGGFLIILFSPVIAILFGMEWQLIKMLVISLICGTPLLSIISVTAASLTLGVSRAGAVFGILAFPLYIPVLIFGASWVVSQDTFNDNMLLLVAMMALLLPLGVIASVAAIKASFED